MKIYAGNFSYDVTEEDLRQAFEQFGKVFQSLLGKRAPACHDLAASRHVRTMCHEPARMRGTDADATSESTRRDRNMLWKRPFFVQRCQHRVEKMPCRERPRVRVRKRGSKMKDPSGGTTGRVKAIWALGVDGRSRLI